MNVLIACEESQRVCMAFRAKGHNAFSCDIIECSGGHPEWHIQGDVLPLLNGFCKFKTMDGTEHEIIGEWDMLIAFPPCTKTSKAGARHLYKGGKLNPSRFYEGMCGKGFFMAIYNAACKKIVIENPTPCRIFEFPEPTQKVHPYHFGHPYSKLTLLWEKGVVQLVPTTPDMQPVGTWVPSNTSAHSKGKGGNKGVARSAVERSKTPLGLAQAMADQWG